jgi:hypothetical protein
MYTNARPTAPVSPSSAMTKNHSRNPQAATMGPTVPNADEGLAQPVMPAVGTRTSACTGDSPIPR